MRSFFHASVSLMAEERLLNKILFRSRLCKDMKTCTKCKKDKNENDFAWKNKAKGKKASRCKECQKLISNDWYSKNTKKHLINVKKNNTLYRDRNRDYVWEYLSSHSCIDCGQNNPIVLEFDHRNPEEKECEIYKLARSMVSMAKLKREIQKCEIRCANCHRIKTAIQFGWWHDKTSSCSSNG